MLAHVIFVRKTLSTHWRLRRRFSLVANLINFVAKLVKMCLLCKLVKSCHVPGVKWGSTTSTWLKNTWRMILPLPSIYAHSIASICSWKRKSLHNFPTPKCAHTFNFTQFSITAKVPKKLQLWCRTARLKRQHPWDHLRHKAVYQHHPVQPQSQQRRPCQ